MKKTHTTNQLCLLVDSISLKYKETINDIADKFGSKRPHGIFPQNVYAKLKEKRLMEAKAIMLLRKSQRSFFQSRSKQIQCRFNQQMFWDVLEVLGKEKGCRSCICPRSHE